MNGTIVLSCLVFALFLLLLPTNFLSMFTDPDTLWHVATGDLIRASGSLPEHDPWSFTAGDWRWLNIAWAWDVAAGWVYQRFGWQGIVAANSVTIAATLSLIFAACLVRSRHGIAAFVATLLAMVMLMNVGARPFQVTLLLTALVAFLLSQVECRQCSPRWLAAVPPVMIVWVNSHGGYLIAFFLLGIHGLAALLKKDRRLTGWLLGTGVAALAACLINPYGIDIATATWRILFCVANPVIGEWAPLRFSASGLLPLIYIALLLILMARRPLPTPASETWIAGLWLLLGISSVRHLSVFAVVSAPMLAAGLREVIVPKTSRPPALAPAVRKLCALVTEAVNSRATALAMLAIAAALSVWMFTLQATRIYGSESFRPLADVADDIAFLKTHYAHTRLITHFNLGGPLIFYGRGTIPLFVDGRTESAYPPQLLRDYMAFTQSDDSLPDILKRYRIDGVLIPLNIAGTRDRFFRQRGWHLAFKGKASAVFLRDREK